MYGDHRDRHVLTHSFPTRRSCDLFDDAPDYVIMFVPGEHFLSAALEHDPQLWDHAFAKRVLLATPTNLIAIARTVAAVWRPEKMADEAKRIGMLGKELYERQIGRASWRERVCQ